MKEKLLISACLLGENCKYSGGNNYTPAVELLRGRYELIPACPEQSGGLPTPRTPAERVGDRVITRDGKDVTTAYHLGAKKALETVQTLHITKAVFQIRSPSCGSETVYDGTFSGTLTSGSGVTAELLEANGVKIYPSDQIAELLEKGEL